MVSMGRCLAYIVLIVSLLWASATTIGCSRIETVRVINHFKQPVRVRLEGDKVFSKLILAGDSIVLDRKYYIGTLPVHVTIFDTGGHFLKEEDVYVPGDSAWRSEAVVTVSP